MRLTSATFCTLLLITGLDFADKSVIVTPSPGLFYGPDKKTELCTRPVHGRRVSIERYDTGFRETETQRTETYLVERNATECIVAHQSPEGWMPYSRTLTAHGSDGQAGSVTHFWWADSTWQPRSRVTIQYQNGHPAVQCSALWDSATGDWTPNYKLESLWDHDQNIMDVHYEFVQGQWQTFSIDNYDYNAQGRVICWQKTELQSNGTWLLTLKTNYEYTGQRLNAQTTQTRLSEECALENFDRTVFSYDENGACVSSREYAWNGATWDGTLKTVTQMQADGTVCHIKMKVSEQRFVNGNTPVLLTPNG